MFSYQHRYHAGNFADVHKHLILIALLNHLEKKPSPFGVLDTHAGEGLYDLSTTESKKNNESQQGFLRLLNQTTLPSLVQQYIHTIQACNTNQQTLYYPGSPKIISQFLREKDSAIFIEGHPQAFDQLRQTFKYHSSHVHLHKRDAHEGLISLLPLKEKRGLIFMDPSYEVKTEYQQIALTLKKAFTRFTQGIYALWYPLLTENYHAKLLRSLQPSSLPKVWHCQWLPDKTFQQGLLGSGMIIINTPWQVDSSIAQNFAELNRTIFLQGAFYQEWLS